MSLTPDENSRYARHLALPEVGPEGQSRLRDASVLVIGTGGLGSPVSLYLAAAGVGRIGIADFDQVEYSNLQRQIIHGTEDVGRPKVASATESINAVNPLVKVESHNVAFKRDNAMEIAAKYDIIIDGTDNFSTRYLVNDVCVLQGKPNCYGSIFRFEGQASVFGLPGGPCYRCLYPQPPDPGLIPNCAEGGVLGVLPGIVGTLQATEAIKLILNIGQPLKGRLLLIDALEMKFRELKLKRDPFCPVCGDQPTIKEPIDYDQFCGVAQTDAPQSDWDIEPNDLKAKLDRGESPSILDVRQPHEYDVCNLGGQLIPLDELPGRLEELDQSKPLIVHCKLGGRSAKAVQLLRESGFDQAFNLKGGIIAWAREIDTEMPTY